jgi:hypothetical protein
MPRRAPARAPLASHTLVAGTLGALLTATLSSTSTAAIVTVQGSATATAGWTDNILNAPDEKTTTTAPRESDFLFQLAPRVALSSASPRFLERLSYNFTADLFATHTEANSYSNTLEWNASVLTSPTTTLVLTLTSQQGKVSTLSFNQPSSGATITVLPQASNFNYFSQTANESFEALPRAQWRVSQLLRFAAFVPIDRGILADSYDVVGEAGFDRVFRADAIGLLLREDVINFVAARDPVTDVVRGADTRQAMTSVVARWRRDWSPLWSTEAALGAIVAVGASSDPTVGTRAAWEPSALAAVRWSKDIGSAELRYSHDVVPNPLVGSTFSRDSVALQGGFPVIRAKMFFGATVAYQHARILPLVAGVAEASADVTVADVTIGWQPIPELGLFARYAFMHQFGAAPIMDTPAPLANLTRNTVMIGLNVIYPAVSKVRVPTRQGTRVDRADQPDFPEVHAPQPR